MNDWKIEVHGTTEYKGDEPLVWASSLDQNFPQRIAVGSVDDAKALRDALTDFLKDK